MMLLCIFINIFTIILLICLIANKYEKQRQIEQFVDGYGHGSTFGEYFPPNPPCDLEFNCFAGLPMRNKTYSNMCEPAIQQIDGLNVGSTCNSEQRLLREPVQPEGNCYRTY